MLNYFLKHNDLFNRVLRTLIAVLLLSSNLAAIHGGALEIMTLHHFTISHYSGLQGLLMLIAWPIFGYLFVIWPFLMGLSLLLKKDLFSLIIKPFRSLYVLG